MELSLMAASPLDELIESLVNAIAADAAATRERHVLRQALQGLVRQAQVEQAVQLRAGALRVARLEGLWHETPQQACSYQ
jgi:hypothetical protein